MAPSLYRSQHHPAQHSLSETCLLLPEQAWSSGWWSAEREEALRALDELMDAPGAWQPLPALFSDGGDGADPGEADGPNRCPAGSLSLF